MLLIALAIASCTPRIAGAHGGTARMALERVPSGDGQEIRLRATLDYAGDGEPVAGATISVDSVAPDGAPGPTTTLQMQDPGVYRGVLGVDAPGTWLVRASSAAPTASAEMTTTIVPAAPPTTGPPDRNVDAEPTPAEATTRSESEHEDSTPLVVAAIAAILLILAAAGWLVQRERRARSLRWQSPMTRSAPEASLRKPRLDDAMPRATNGNGEDARTARGDRDT